MKRYRMVPRAVDAVQFDGTAAGAERVMAWGRAVAPAWPIRPRTEYSGWGDTTGHLELEIMGQEMGCMAGDWIVMTIVADKSSLWIIDEGSFGKYYEEVVG